MAEKVIKVCDWHEDGETEAVYRNRWTNVNGQRKRNDLCQSHQFDFLEMWERLEMGSQLDTEDTPTSPAPTKKARRGTTTKPPGDRALARAWAKSQGLVVPDKGGISWQIEQKWREAGRPNVLDNLSSSS